MKEDPKVEFAGSGGRGGVTIVRIVAGDVFVGGGSTLGAGRGRLVVIRAAAIQLLSVPSVQRDEI